MIGIIIYGIGVALSIIIQILVVCNKYRRITLEDLFTSLVISAFSWLTIVYLVIFTNDLDDIILYNRNKDSSPIITGIVFIAIVISTLIKIILCLSKYIE